MSGGRHCGTLAQGSFSSSGLCGFMLFIGIPSQRAKKPLVMVYTPRSTNRNTDEHTTGEDGKGEEDHRTLCLFCYTRHDSTTTLKERTTMATKPDRATQSEDEF